MAKKISQLDNAEALGDLDMFEVVQSGVNKKMTGAQMRAPVVSLAVTVGIAQDSANTALTKANSVEGLATTANANASAALGVANAISGTATAADSKATSALNASNLASAKVDTFGEVVQQASNNANVALTIANGVTDAAEAAAVLAQQAMDNASNATVIAGTANTNAAEALAAATTASEAVGDAAARADAAFDLATDASTDVVTAQARADLAVTNAATAQTQATLGVTNAATAQTKANSAFTNAATAQTRADLGVTNAGTAQTRADLGVANAATAQTQANLGVTNAATAQTQANLGVTNAATAQARADLAVTNAATAQTTADATAAATALTSRTVTASTTIATSDHHLRYNIASGTVSQTLPTLTGSKKLLIDKVSTTGTLTLTPAAGDTINGTSSYSLALAVRQGIEIFYDSVSKDWTITGHNVPLSTLSVTGNGTVGGTLAVTGDLTSGGNISSAGLVLLGNGLGGGLLWDAGVIRLVTPGAVSDFSLSNTAAGSSVPFTAPSLNTGGAVTATGGVYALGGLQIGTTAGTSIVSSGADQMTFNSSGGGQVFLTSAGLTSAVPITTSGLIVSGGAVINTNSVLIANPSAGNAGIDTQIAGSHASAFIGQAAAGGNFGAGIYSFSAAGSVSNNMIMDHTGVSFAVGPVLTPSLQVGNTAGNGIVADSTSIQLSTGTGAAINLNLTRALFNVPLNAAAGITLPQSSFIPTLLGGTTTYLLQFGRYQVIGTQVFFALAVYWSATTATIIDIGNLPYSASEYCPVSMTADSIVFTGQLSSYVVQSTTSIRVTEVISGATMVSVPAPPTGSCGVTICGSYFI